MGNELEAYERAGLQKLMQWVKKWVKTREWTNYAMLTNEMDYNGT